MHILLLCRTFVVIKKKKRAFFLIQIITEGFIYIFMLAKEVKEKKAASFELPLLPNIINKSDTQCAFYDGKIIHTRSHRFLSMHGNNFTCTSTMPTVVKYN